MIAIPHGLAAEVLRALQDGPRTTGQIVDAIQVSQRIAWTGGEPFMVIAADRLIYVGPPRDLDLVLRPRRRGQRPAGIPRSAWWRMPRRERRQIGGAP